MAGTSLAPEVLAEKLRPLKRVEYDRLVEIGVFEGERIELLCGALVEMSPQKAPHAGVIEALTERLVPALAGRATVRVQLPLAVSDDSEPEPDIAVVSRGPHRESHPATAFLVVEVSAGSLRRDRRLKAALYARADIQEYWVVNVRRRRIEVLRNPERARYRQVTPRGRGEAIALLAFPDVTVAVDDVVG